jgi:hypothetical protein
MTKYVVRRSTQRAVRDSVTDVPVHPMAVPPGPHTHDVETSREVFDVVVGTHCPPHDHHPTTRPMTRETMLLSHYPIRTSYYCLAPPHPTEIRSTTFAVTTGQRRS